MWDGLSRAASYLRLVNPCRIERFRLCRDNDSHHIQTVAIALSYPFASHSGIFYRTESGEVRIIHLANHRVLEDEECDADEFSWVVPDVRPHLATQLCELCALAARVKPEIDYGYRYDEASIFSVLDASFSLGDQSIGLTCATFVLAMFRSCGIHLVRPNKWRITSADIAAQMRAIPNIARTNVAHQNRLRAEIGEGRISPPQVSGAASHDRFPVSYGSAESAAILILQAQNDHYARLVENGKY